MDKIDGIHILLVEDNRADADLVREMILERKMGSIDIVEDGEQALMYLRKKDVYAKSCRPDLVILDLNLPKVHGRDVLKEVKSDADLRRIPILIFTSSEAERDIFDSYDLNANCYIQKPINFDELSGLFDLFNEFWVRAAKLPPKEWRKKNG